MMDFRNTKIRIKSPEHSEAFQRAVFEAGGQWAISGKEIINNDVPFIFVIFVDNNLYLWGCSDEDYFLRDENKEITWPPESKGDFVDLGQSIEKKLNDLKFKSAMLEQALIIIAASGDDNSRYYAHRALEAVK